MLRRPIISDSSISTEELIKLSSGLKAAELEDVKRYIADILLPKIEVKCTYLRNNTDKCTI